MILDPEVKQFLEKEMNDKGISIEQYAYPEIDAYNIILGQRANNQTDALNYATREYRKVRERFAAQTKRCERKENLEDFFNVTGQDVSYWRQVRFRFRDGKINVADGGDIEYDNRLAYFVCPNGKKIVCRRISNSNFLKAVLEDIDQYRPNRKGRVTNEGSTSTQNTKPRVNLSKQTGNNLPLQKGQQEVVVNDSLFNSLVLLQERVLDATEQNKTDALKRYDNYNDGAQQFSNQVSSHFSQPPSLNTSSASSTDHQLGACVNDANDDDMEIGRMIGEALGLNFVDMASGLSKQVPQVSAGDCNRSMTSSNESTVVSEDDEENNFDFDFDFFKV